MRDWREDTNWHRLTGAVARLKRRVERAYHYCDEDAADAAHDDLCAAEWRLRQAEKRRGRT